jgi:hypothetical protein
MPAIKLIVVYRAVAFERYAPELLGIDGVEEFVDFIAASPLAGQVIPGTGGMRKVRWSRPGIGKRGGVRVIYYYHSDAVPVGLFTIYGKGMKDNLTANEKATFRKVIAGIKLELERMTHHRKPTEVRRHD